MKPYTETASTIFSDFYNNKRHLPNDSLLYHFTKADSLIHILEDMTLRLSTIEDLNDLREGEMQCLQYGFDDLQSQSSFEQLFIPQNCSLISFSTNFRRNNCVYPGTMHQRMWAQYAEDHYGACLVLRAKEIMRVNQNLFQSPDSFACLERVEYGDFIYAGEKIEKDEYFSYIKKHYRDIFFHKNPDWKEEREMRLLGVNLSNRFISIDGAIDHICLGNRFLQERKDKKEYGMLLFRSLTNENNKCFGIINAHSFSIIRYHEGHCHEVPASFFLMRAIPPHLRESSAYKDFFQISLEKTN